jgi:hypothetical protein
MAQVQGSGPTPPIAVPMMDMSEGEKSAPDRETPDEPTREPLGPVEVPEPGVVDVPEPGIVEVPERRV